MIIQEVVKGVAQNQETTEMRIVTALAQNLKQRANMKPRHQLLKKSTT
jgi:hypothetical protein